MSASLFRLGLLLDHTSPHMVDLLDALAEEPDVAAFVGYLRKGNPHRCWGQPTGRLPWSVLTGVDLTGRGTMLNPWLGGWLESQKADAWVVNTIATAPSTSLAVRHLSKGGRCWAFMAEAPRPAGRGRWLSCRLRDWLLRWILARARGAIGMGLEPARRLQALAGPQLPITSVPYCQRLGEFLELPLPVPPTAGQPVRFVTVCQLIPRKGLDVLLRACQMLPRGGWQLEIFGQGRWQRQLAAEIARLRLPVRLRGPAAFAERRAAYYGQHCFVFSTRWDGWGMALVEARAAGLPVITTDQAMSAHELVRHDRDGFVGRAGDPEFLAQAMSRYLQDSALIAKHAARSRQLLSAYRPDAGAQRLVAFMRCLWESQLSATAEKGGRWISHRRYPACRERSGLPSGVRETLTTDSAPPSWRALVPRVGLRNRAKQLLFGALAPMTARRPCRAGHRILVYHLVLPEDRERFRTHLRFLKDHYDLRRLDRLPGIHGNPPEPGLTACAITFDDAFAVLTGTCLEVLTAEDVSACFYVPTGFVQLHDNRRAWTDYSCRCYCYHHPLAPMRPRDLSELLSLGHLIGAHGISHTALSRLPARQARHELLESRRVLEGWTGTPTRTFAYPYGIWRTNLGCMRQWVEQAGYVSAVSLQRGPLTAESDSLRLNREHLEGCWPLASLRYFLTL